MLLEWQWSGLYRATRFILQAISKDILPMTIFRSQVVGFGWDQRKLGLSLHCLSLFLFKFLGSAPLLRFSLTI